MSLNWQEKKDLENRRTKAIEEYWTVIDAPEGSIKAKNPLVQELVELCRASDAFVVTSFKTENYELQIQRLVRTGICTPAEKKILEDFREELLLAEVAFYQKFVAFARKLENDRARVLGEIGSIKSEKKAKSSRENGKKGGRPPKNKED